MTFSLASLCWLFLGGSDASAYHRLSRVSKHPEGDMTSDLVAPANNGRTNNRPTSWRFGKTKVRLD
jgi:hypothetical protein